VELLGRERVGLSADPEVCALGDGGTMFPRSAGALTAYRLRRRSPLIGSGIGAEAVGC
jgi:hypothetical protein